MKYKLNRTYRTKLYAENHSMTIDDSPCARCKNTCDGWEARYCCTLCHYISDEPDCDSCDPWDI